MEVIHGAAKHANDGLYAAVELGQQTGLGDQVIGKRALLSDLAAALVAARDDASATQLPFLEQAIAFIGAALQLGGGDLASIPAEYYGAIHAKVADFEADSGASRPIGFYTWDEELEQVFRQDRFLQSQHEFSDTLGSAFGRYVAIAAVLEQNAELSEAYQRVLSVYAGLTNPYVAYPMTALFDHVDGLASLDQLEAVKSSFLAANPVRFPCPEQYPYLALLPASASKDTRLFNDLFCHSQPPAEITFMDILINAIRDSVIDLTPDASSGWYDYQLHALETLLVPELALEADHLLLTASYK